MVKDNRSVIGWLALLAVLLVGTLAPPARATFGVESRFDVIVPPGLSSFAVRDMAADVDGSVYVLWTGVVQRYDASGVLVGSWGGFGSAPGQFSPPGQVHYSTEALEVDGLGHVYVTDHPGNRIVKFTTGGEFVSTLDGFDGPNRIGIDEAGNLLVAEEPRRGMEAAPPPRIRRISPDGAVLASGPGWFLQFAAGPADRLYAWWSTGAGEAVRRYEGPEFAPSRAFPLLFGDLPDERGNYSPSCCGIAFVGGRVWIARSSIHTVEAYGPEGGFLAACPAPNAITTLAAGRNGRLYALTQKGVIRYGDGAAQACDTEPPTVTPPGLSQRTLRASSYKRLRSATMWFGSSEQGTVELTFTRLVEGRRVDGRCARRTRRNRRRPTCVRRRVTEAVFDGIKASVPDGVKVRFVELLWRERLPVGRYEIGIVAADRAGLRSAPVTVRVRLSR